MILRDTRGKAKDNWLEISTEEGNVGWVDSSFLESNKQKTMNLVFRFLIMVLFASFGACIRWLIYRKHPLGHYLRDNLYYNLTVGVLFVTTLLALFQYFFSWF